LASLADPVDHAKFIAHDVLSRAIEDEARYAGAANITVTLACFIEFRIAEILRPHLPEECQSTRFDA
jgi:hypothetical protein